MAGGAGNDAGMGGGMAGSTGSSAVSPATRLSDNSIREGMYVSKDQTLFWINDFREAWGIVAFTKENEKYIRKGQPLSITSELMPEKELYNSCSIPGAGVSGRAKIQPGKGVFTQYLGDT